MKSILRLLFIFTSILLLWTLNSCRKDVTNPNVSIKTVIIEDEGLFNFLPELTYAVVDSVTYHINITTEPTGVAIYYSINGGDILQKNAEYIPIDFNDKYISFFSTSSGVCMEGNNRLDFGFGNDSLESEITLFPNPFDSIVSFKFESNIRGILHFEVMDVRGEVQFSNDYFIDEKIIVDSMNLSTLPFGIYFFVFNYGKSQNVKRATKH